MKSILALSSAALLAAVNAEDPISLGSADDVKSDQWESVMEDYNMTATRKFTGRDISSSYPSKSQDDWEIKLFTKENVESPDGDSKYVVGTTLSMTSPNGDDVQVDDSWKLCVHVFPVKSGSSASDIGGDESCKGVVAVECVEDLKKNAVKKYNKDGNCDAYEITPSCLRDLNEGEGYSLTVDSDSADSLLGSNKTFLRWAGDGHEGDDAEHMAFNDGAASHGYAVVNVFGSADKAEDEAFAEVRCLLPDTSNSEEGKSSDESSAMALGRFVGWTALTGIVAFQFLL